MEKKKRYAGFYWVKYSGDWVVAEYWEGIHWLMAGTSDVFTDADFEHISELPLQNYSTPAMKALEIISDPIAYLKNEAEKDGGKLNGGMALMIANDANWLSSVAKKALGK